MSLGIRLMSLAFAAMASLLSLLAWTPHAGAQTPRAQKPVKVAAVDFVPVWADLDGNIARLAQAAE